MVPASGFQFLRIEASEQSVHDYVMEKKIHALKRVVGYVLEIMIRIMSVSLKKDKEDNTNFISTATHFETIVFVFD